MSLKDLIARDIDCVFLNPNEYCDNLIIQVGTRKFPVIGSLQSNSVENNSGNGQPLQSDAWTLYIKYPMADDLETSILSSGTRITVDNKSFTIVSVSDELGLATIQLETRTGR